MLKDWSVSEPKGTLQLVVSSVPHTEQENPFVLWETFKYCAYFQMNNHQKKKKKRDTVWAWGMTSLNWESTVRFQRPHDRTLGTGSRFPADLWAIRDQGVAWDSEDKSTVCLYPHWTPVRNMMNGGHHRDGGVVPASNSHGREPGLCVWRAVRFWHPWEWGCCHQELSV